MKVYVDLTENDKRALERALFYGERACQGTCVYDEMATSKLADCKNCCYVKGLDSLRRKFSSPKSLSDYTKQVRKEVLDQVYKVFTTESMWKEIKDWWLQCGTCQELKNCLDAIVEETSVENIVKRFGHDSKLYQLLDQIQGETNEK